MDWVALGCNKKYVVIVQLMIELSYNRTLDVAGCPDIPVHR